MIFRYQYLITKDMERIYNPELSQLYISLRAKPPRHQAEAIQRIPTGKVKEFGKDSTPAGLLRMFQNRIHEISQEGLSDFEIGRILFANQQEAEMRYFQRAVQQGNTRAYAYIGGMHLAKGEMQEAYTALQKGTDSEAKLLLSNYQSQIGNLDEATRTIQEAIRMATQEENPAKGGMYKNLSTLLLQQGNHEQALEYAWPAARGGFPEAYQTICAIYHALGNDRLMCDALNEAARFGYGPAIVASAVMLYESKRPREAEENIALLQETGYTPTPEEKSQIAFAKAGGQIDQSIN